MSADFYRDAQPVEKLKDAYRKFLIRSMRKPNVVEVCGFGKLFCLVDI
jgi:hypothetical protein